VFCALAPCAQLLGPYPLALALWTLYSGTLCGVNKPLHLALAPLWPLTLWPCVWFTSDFALVPQASCCISTLVRISINSVECVLVCVLICSRSSYLSFIMCVHLLPSHVMRVLTPFALCCCCRRPYSTRISAYLPASLHQGSSWMLPHEPKRACRQSLLQQER